MDIYEIIRRPLVTEKGTRMSKRTHEQTHSRPARGGAYAFEVHPEATKPQIREAVEKIYNVKVDDVRTSNRKGKVRRYRFRFGTTPHWKCAVVVLGPEYHIDLF